MRLIASLLICAVALHADFSYRSRISITGGELYASLAASGKHGADPITVTKLIKGYRMAILSHQHTTVIDVNSETITEIDYAKKNYSVIPFAMMKRALDAAEAKAVHQATFDIAPQAPSGLGKPPGILNPEEKAFRLTAPGGSIQVELDTWIGTIPGYEQLTDFNAKLASKLGWTFASGFSELALRAPESWQALGEAARQLNQSLGAPLMTTLKITAADRLLLEGSVELTNFGGGVQENSKFDPPAGFKKVDPVLPAVP